MDAALARAFANGTRAMRTHIDSQEGRTEPAWTAFEAVRAAWRRRIEIEPAVSLGAGKLMGDYGETVARLAASRGAVLGPVLYPGPDIDAHIARAFDLAERFGLDLDFHVDENLDPMSDGLARVARMRIDRDFKSRVLCGHGCALALKPEAEIAATAASLREAEVDFVSLPQTNAFLLGRSDDAVPRLRALPPLKSLLAAGVNAALASDNCQDPFNPAGDYNLVEIWRDAALQAHLPAPFEPALAMIAGNAATALGLDARGIAAGAPADLVVFEARDAADLFARPATPRRALVRGRPAA